MKKKLTTVAVLGLVVACGFAQPAEAGWFKDALSSVKNKVVGGAAAFVASKTCAELDTKKIPKALQKYRISGQASGCALAIAKKNDPAGSLKSITGGPGKIFGDGTGYAALDNDNELDKGSEADIKREEREAAAQELALQNWAEFVETPIGKEWKLTNEVPPAISEFLEDVE